MSTALGFDPVRRPHGIAAASHSSAAGNPALHARSANAFAPRSSEQFAPEFEPSTALEVVADRGVRRGRPRVVVAGTVVAGLAAVLGVQLLLSIQTDAAAVAVNSLQAQSVELSREQQVQSEALERLAAPQQLAAAARRLGMVPTLSTAYLRASDGRVLGSAHPAGHSVIVGNSAVPDALLTPGH